MLSHPELPSCESCQTWLYDKNWRITTRGDPKQPIRRSKHDPLPCVSCPKIPLGKKPCPANAVELSPKNLKALSYFYRRQVDYRGDLPADEITLSNDATILRIQQQFSFHQQSAMAGSMSMIGTMAAR